MKKAVCHCGTQHSRRSSVDPTMCALCVPDTWTMPESWKPKNKNKTNVEINSLDEENEDDEQEDFMPEMPKEV